MTIIRNDADYAVAKAAGFTPKFHNLDGFAEAAFDSNSLQEIINCQTAEADENDMNEWGINETEWRDAQVRAIEWAMFNAAEMRLAAIRREIGPEALNGHVNEKFNSTESEVDADGSMWICNPQSGHWADADKINDFLDWLDNQ